MKVYSQVSKILKKIRNAKSDKFLEELEGILNVYLLVFLFGEFEYPFKEIKLDQVQAKYLNTITFVILNKILESKYHFNETTKILQICCLNLSNMKILMQKNHSENIANLNKINEFFSSLETKASLNVSIPSVANQRDRFLVMVALYYGVIGLVKILLMTSSQINNQELKNILGRVALYMLCDQKFDVSIHYEVLLYLLKDGANATVTIKEIAVSDINQSYNLRDIAVLKGCPEIKERRMSTQIKSVDVKLLLENFSLFSDQDLQERISKMAYQWSPEDFIDAVRNLSSNGYFKTLSYLLSSHPEMIVQTKKILNRGTLKVTTLSSTQEFNFSIYFELFSRLDEIRDKYLFKLIDIFIENKCIEISHPLPLFIVLGSKIDNEKKCLVLDHLFKVGFELVQCAENTEISSIDVISASNNFAILDYILSKSVLAKKYSNLVQVVYKTAKKHHDSKTVIHLNRTYPSKMPPLTDKMIGIYLQKFILQSKRDYTLLDEIIQLAKTNNLNLDMVVGYPMEEAFFLAPSTAKVHKKLLSLPKITYFITPLGVMLVQNDEQGFAKFYKAGASISKYFPKQNLHQLQLAAAFASDTILTTMLSDPELNLICENNQIKVEKQQVFEDVIKMLISREKYDHIKQLFAHPNFKNKFNLSIASLYILFDTDFSDAETIKNTWSDQYLKLKEFYSNFLLTSKHEEYFLALCEFILPRISENFEELIKDIKIYHELLITLFNHCMRAAVLSKLKLASLAEEDCADLLNLMEVVRQDIVKVVKEKNQYIVNVPLAIADPVNYLKIVRDLIFLLAKHDKVFAPHVTPNKLNFFELLCLGDFPTLLQEIMEIPQFNDVLDNEQQKKMLMLSAILNRAEIINILLKNFSYNHVLIIEALQVAIKQDSVDATYLLLKQLDSLLNGENLIPQIKYLHKRLSSDQEQIKCLLEVYLEKQKSVQSNGDKKKVSELRTIATAVLPVKSGHSIYQFFNVAGAPCYVYIKNKHLQAENTLYDQLAGIIKKNKENFTLANKNIVYVGGKSNYGGAEYKIRLWGDNSDMRLLMFPENTSTLSKKENNPNEDKSENVQVYRAKLMPKHRKG